MYNYAYTSTSAILWICACKTFGGHIKVVSDDFQLPQSHNHKNDKDFLIITVVKEKNISKMF